MATLQELVNETTNIKDELKTCHTNLSTALTEKGVEVSSEDKMSSLIDKVSGIALGKKWASGLSVSSNSMIRFAAYSNNSPTYQLYYVDIQLDFTPSIIVCLDIDQNSAYRPITVFSYNSNLKYNIVATTNMRIDQTHVDGTAPIAINDIVLLGNNTFRLPAGDNYSSRNIAWYAFE